MATETTTAKLASGEPFTFRFGSDFVVGISTPSGRDDGFVGRLEKRAANGDLVFLVDSSGTTRRVRPSKVIDAEPYWQEPFGDDPTEKTLAAAVALADSLASELGHDPDAVAAEVVRQMPELAHLDGDEPPTYAGPMVPDVLEGEDGTAYLRRIERELGIGAALWRARQYARFVETETGQATLERANALRSKPVRETEPSTKKRTAKPYSERNQVWKCGSCGKRTRRPFCANGHDQVDAPAGKRRDDR